MVTECARREAIGLAERVSANPEGAARARAVLPTIGVDPKQEGKQTMNLQEAIKGMGVKSWERRENSSGKCTVYVRFVPKKPIETMDVKEEE